MRTPALPVEVLAEPLRRLREELDVPRPHAAEVVADAERRAASGPRHGTRRDLTDLPFVTVDPPGARDLDQAVLVVADGGGWRVRYAIADVAAFVDTRTVDAPLEADADARGATVYLPQESVPLWPGALAHGAASLLAGQDRPAVVFDVLLDGDGEVVSHAVERATVRSRAQLTYEQAQAGVDAGDPALSALATVGRLRAEREWVRGGVSLELPEQEVERVDGRRWRLAVRARLPVEDASAQVSVLTGHVAATTMLDGGVGLLRTLPPPADDALDALRRRAHALGVPWPAEVRLADALRALDVTRPAHAALAWAARTVLRGAAWTRVADLAPPGGDGGVEPVHGALALPYAHVTAPLRRLGDHVLHEVLLALHTDEEVDDDLRARLVALPERLAHGRGVQSRVERAVVDLAEALLAEGLGDRTLAATTLDDRGLVQVAEPPLVARLDDEDPPPAGRAVTVRVAEVDVAARRVGLRLVPGARVA